jgi:hypothetical protein
MTIPTSPEISGRWLRWYGQILWSGLPGVSSVKGALRLVAVTAPSFLRAIRASVYAFALSSSASMRETNVPLASDGGILLLRRRALKCP